MNTITIIQRYFVRSGPLAGMNISLTIIKTALLIALCYIGTAIGCLAGDLSVETIGAVRFVGIDKGEQYGAGVGAAYSFNRFVALTGRALAYESPDNWRGSTVDEAGAGIEATFLRSGRLSLAAVAGANYSFASDDIGLGAGSRLTIGIIGKLYGVAGAEWRLWDKQESDILVTAGIGLKF